MLIVLTGEAALEDDAVASDKVRQAGFKHMVGIGEEHESANDGLLAFFRSATLPRASVISTAARSAWSSSSHQPGSQTG